MKTLFTVCAALLCILCLDIGVTPSITQFPTSCSASPYAVDVHQEDGTEITVIGVGNAIIHHTETIDGYTIIKNRSHIYEYANQGRDGKLISTGIKANNPEQRARRERRILLRLDKHIRVGENIREELTNDYSRNPAFTSSHNAMRFPSTGNRRALVILIQYPDLPHEYSHTDFDQLMNEEDYNGTGSFRDYFMKNSQGALDIDADVFGWYTSEHDYSYYGYHNGFQRSRALMAEAIDAAEEAGVDFSNYDNDGDGFVDAVIGIHAGPGAEVGAQMEYIWSHRWTLGAQHQRIYDGVVLSDYMINPETRPWGMVGVGVICHEFGHVLGLPDLYDPDNSSSGLGNWALMSKGAWLNFETTPANMCAWSKQKNEWIDPEVISEGVYSLNAADNHAGCYRINTENPEEYFLLENRQNYGNDAFLPGHGLAIWHIDENMTSLYPGSNNVNLDESNKGVDLEEADGQYDLDSGPFNGDDGDLFPGSSWQTVFNADSDPSSNLYDGSMSDISVTNIYELEDKVYFRLNDEVSCSIVHAEAGPSFNCGNGRYDQEVTVTFDYPPNAGMLVVNGYEFEIGSSPQTVLLEGLPADGVMMALEVEFSIETGCTLVIPDGLVTPRSYSTYIESTTCDPLAAGSEVFHLSTVAGCDSTVTVVTELLPSYDYTVTSPTCVVEDAGLFVYHMLTVAGCDSIVTLIKEYIVPDTIVVQLASCDPGAAGIELLHLETTDGCDSLVVIKTALLNNSHEVITLYSCDPDNAGHDIMIFEAANGCDSIIEINTIFSPSYDMVFDEITCDPELTGTISDLYATAHGCDSMVTVNRTYTEFSNSFDYTSNELAVTFVNESVNGTHYIWFLGDGTVSTSMSPVHEYREEGMYLVMLMALNNECLKMEVSTQWIYVGAAGDNVAIDQDPDIDETAELYTYPNPTFGPVNLEVKGFNDETVQMSLFDIEGHLVMEERLQNGNGDYQFDLAGAGPGIYIMQVASAKETVNKRIFLTN